MIENDWELTRHCPCNVWIIGIDLKILTKPKIKNNNLTNLHSILLETADKKSTHGKGKMYASVMKKVSFTKSYNCAKKLQKKDMIVYGPLNIFGTNCSRFVSKLMFKSLKFSFKRYKNSFRLCKWCRV